MANLLTCTRCGDLYSVGSAACPTCNAPRTGTEAVTYHPDSARPANSVGASPASGAQHVVVTDFDMPFGSMVTFMVKWAIAAIPAVIILFIIFAMLGAMLGGMLGGLMRH